MNTDWKNILIILEKRLKPGIYGVWIKPLTASIRERELTITAPNEFVASWVTERLLTDIQNASKEVLGFTPNVVIRGLAPDKAAPVTERPVSFGPVEQIALPMVIEPKHYEIQTRNWQYDFDDFVTGPSNELAFAAARAVCETTMASDQIFLSSSPGLGKTHLLHAIGKEFSRKCNRNARVVYLSSEEFATQMVIALKAGEIERFKAKYRDCTDVLLLEDVHFFQGKEKLQAELLATIKALRAWGKKVVFTSSFLPKELSGVDSQLTSRFCSGLLALIEKPELETRKAIIRKKASAYQAFVPEDVTELLATGITSDIRQLVSCLQNLILKASLLRQRINADLAGEVMKHYMLEQPAFCLEKLVEYVCESFGVSKEQLNSRSRRREIVLARNTAFYLARKHTGLSLQDIGEPLNRKHSTVLKGITNIEREINHSTALGSQINRVIRNFESRARQ